MARRQQHAGRIARSARRHRIERIAQQIRIAVDRADREDVEQFRAQPQHRLAILQHVGDAGRGPCIILQHEEIVGAGADQIDAADMGVDAVRRPRAGDLDAELRIAEHDVGRDDAVGDDPPRAVNVVDEGVDRPHALFEPDR